MEVSKDVNVRKRALDINIGVELSGKTKRRKVGGGQLDDHHFSSWSNLTNDQLINTTFCQIPEANFVSQPELTASNFSYGTDRADHASCCSSNESAAEASIQKLNFTDLENENAETEASSSSTAKSDGCMISKEIKQLNQHCGESVVQDSTSEISCGRQTTTEKMPSEAELEEFFVVAERNLQKQFRDKYNYDISTDEPLNGRYEWLLR